MVSNTNLYQKLGPSIINVVFVLMLGGVLSYLSGFNFLDKLNIVLLFFCYEFICIFLFKGRDIGMIIFRTHWKKPYNLNRLLAFNLFYSLSFATLFFFVFFPFDLFIFNFLFLQIPCLILTKKTFHGFITNVESVKLS